MKKIVILTASTGGGHDKAAAVLKEMYKNSGYEVSIVNILKLLNKIIEHAFVDGYDVLYQSFPKLYSSMYKHSDNPIFKPGIVGRLFKKKMLDILYKENPCVIIGTHAFSVGIISLLKKRDKINIPFICIVTDFKAHAAYYSDYVDAYILGSKDTLEDMVDKGMKRDRLYSLGIPVDKKFYSTNKGIIHGDKPVVMVMGGSLCNLDMLGVIEALEGCSSSFNIISVCGRDEEAYKRVMSYAKGVDNRNIYIYSFTNRIPELMASSTLLITKPGGLTISEALVSKLPLVIPKTLPGQEEDNLTFLLNHNMAFKSDGLTNITSIVDGALEDESTIARMKTEMEKITKDYDMESIIELTDKLCQL